MGILMNELGYIGTSGCVLEVVYIDLIFVYMSGWSCVWMVGFVWVVWMGRIHNDWIGIDLDIDAIGYDVIFSARFV